MKPEQFIIDYERALGTQEWENVAALMHPDICVTFSTGSVHKGIAEVKAAFEHNFAMIKSEVYKISDVHWVVKTTAVAVYVFNYQWQGVIDGRPAAGQGRGTATLVAEDGCWKLLAEHLGLSKGA